MAVNASGVNLDALNIQDNAAIDNNPLDDPYIASIIAQYIAKGSYKRSLDTRRRFAGNLAAVSRPFKEALDSVYISQGGHLAGTIQTLYDIYKFWNNVNVINDNIFKRLPMTGLHSWKGTVYSKLEQEFANDMIVYVNGWPWWGILSLRNLVSIELAKSPEQKFLYECFMEFGSELEGISMVDLSHLAFVQDQKDVLARIKTLFQPTTQYMTLSFMMRNRPISNSNSISKSTLSDQTLIDIFKKNFSGLISSVRIIMTFNGVDSARNTKRYVKFYEVGGDVYLGPMKSHTKRLKKRYDEAKGTIAPNYQVANIDDEVTKIEINNCISFDVSECFIRVMVKDYVDFGTTGTLLFKDDEPVKYLEMGYLLIPDIESPNETILKQPKARNDFNEAIKNVRELLSYKVKMLHPGQRV